MEDYFSCNFFGQSYVYVVSSLDDYQLMATQRENVNVLQRSEVVQMYAQRGDYWRKQLGQKTLVLSCPVLVNLKLDFCTITLSSNLNSGSLKPSLKLRQGTGLRLIT